MLHIKRDTKKCSTYKENQPENPSAGQKNTSNCELKLQPRTGPAILGATGYVASDSSLNPKPRSTSSL